MNSTSRRARWVNGVACLGREVANIIRMEPINVTHSIIKSN